jgi:hypothetical protein
VDFRLRSGIADGGEIEFRQPVTEFDDCNIADVLFISQIYNVKPHYWQYSCWQ